MKPFKHYILLLILLLPALAACSAQPAAATLTPTPGFQRGGGGTRQAGSGFNGTRAAGGGGSGTFAPPASATPAPTLTPLPSRTPTLTETPVPSATQAPTLTRTTIPLSDYDVRVTITNDTDSPIEYTFIGPVDGPAQVSIYLYINKGETGFLRTPHGRFSVVMTTAGKTSQVQYVLSAGSYGCKLSKGCSAFQTP